MFNWRRHGRLESLGSFFISFPAMQSHTKVTTKTTKVHQSSGTSSSSWGVSWRDAGVCPLDWILAWCVPALSLQPVWASSPSSTISRCCQSPANWQQPVSATQSKKPWEENLPSCKLFFFFFPPNEFYCQKPHVLCEFNADIYLCTDEISWKWSHFSSGVFRSHLEAILPKLKGKLFQTLHF